MRGKHAVGVGIVGLRRIIPAHAGQTSARARATSSDSDHPRACGANSVRSPRSELQCGSSPRMRGKQVAQSHVSIAERIIPAHAGQTPAMPHRAGSSPDHPRACGANRRRSSTSKALPGSSPRMRGKLHAAEAHTRACRIIPAHAGQTISNRAMANDHTDHPRACGANPVDTRASSPSPGSSPRMRGKPGARFWQSVRHRIIPAHAGQTQSGHLAGSVLTDHPRACGANYVGADYRLVSAGSSPRMRGKLQQGQRHSERVRIIPAHAGQTQWQPKYSDRRPDHPRACGANGGLRAMGETCGGSSPRMRGKLLALIRHYEQNRIIPAHAGQTCATPCTALRSSDHPRACGANVRDTMYGTTQFGSSPRMRGKRARHHVRHYAVRIIPAHAGQTRLLTPECTPLSDHPRACGANVRFPV